MTRIAILGAAGRMGQALLRCAERRDDVACVAALERSGHPALGRDAGIEAGAGETGVKLVADADAINAAQAVVDFTFHTTAPKHAAQAAEASQAYILGATGLSEAEIEAVREAAQRIPVVCAPNMSLGINVLLDLVQRAAGLLDATYDVEIVEMHHRHKKDAPSGTALALAEHVVRGRGYDRPLSEMMDHGRSGMSDERPAKRIGMHALRGGDVVGDHTVMFAAEGERIELTHKASSRDAFAMGALTAAVWAVGRAPGFYTMRHVLGLDPTT